MHLLQHSNPHSLPPTTLTQATTEDWQTYRLTECDTPLRPMAADELEELLPLLHQMTGMEDILPLWINGQSDYIGVYIRGALQGKVCYLDHEECDLSPMFQIHF